MPQSVGVEGAVSKFSKLTSADIRTAVDKLRKAAANTLCHFCHKPRVDAFQSVIVEVHKKCSEKARRRIDNRIDKFVSRMMK